MKSVYKRNIAAVQAAIAERLMLEDKMVKRLVAQAALHGFKPRSTNDGEEWESTTTLDEVLGVVFSVDESVVYFANTKKNRDFECYIVLGNDGYDCLSDFRASEDDFEFVDRNIIAPLMEYANQLEAEL